MTNLTFNRFNSVKVLLLVSVTSLLGMNYVYFSDSTNVTPNFLTDTVYISYMSTPICLLFLAIFSYSQIVIFNFANKALVIKNRYSGKKREIPFISFTNTWAIAVRDGGFLIYASTIDKKKVFLFYQLKNDHYKLLRESLEKETSKPFPLNLGKPIN